MASVNRHVSGFAGIKILRQSNSLTFVNACTVNAELRITMFVPANVPFYIYPFDGYLPDLQAKLGDQIAPILLHTELSRILQADITLEMVQDIVAENFQVDVEELRDYKAFAVVRFPPHEDDYFELVFTGNETIDRDSQIRGHLTQNLSLKTNFWHVSGASLYIDFLTN